MPVRIKEEKPTMFNVSKLSRYKVPTSQSAQSSESPAGGIQIEEKEMLRKQILGQGDYKGKSHVLNDPNNSTDRGLQIDNWGLAFNGIQQRSGAFGKEYKKHHIPDEEYTSHFSI